MGDVVLKFCVIFLAVRGLFFYIGLIINKK